MPDLHPPPSSLMLRVAHHLRNLPASSEFEDVKLAAELEAAAKIEYVAVDALLSCDYALSAAARAVGDHPSAEPALVARLALGAAVRTARR